MKEIPKCWREDGQVWIGHVNKKGKIQGYVELLEVAADIQQRMNDVPGPCYKEQWDADDEDGKNVGRFTIKVWNQ